MRHLFSLTLLLGSVTLARTQQPPDADLPREPDPRYGIPPKLKVFPQGTPKRALASAIEAIERPDIPYLLAHLLDPGFVEFRLNDRAKQFEAPVEVELTRLRNFQIRNPEKFSPKERLPGDKVKFNALIVERSRELAFKQLVRDVEEKLLDDPQALKDMKKLLKDGTFEDTENGTKVTHMDVKNRALYFRKVDDRWFLQNHQEDLPKKEPGM
jgi:hypothetical protein